jgi:hypothetical protein
MPEDIEINSLGMLYELLFKRPPIVEDGQKLHIPSAQIAIAFPQSKDAGDLVERVSAGGELFIRVIYSLENYQPTYHASFKDSNFAMVFKPEGEWTMSNATDRACTYLKVRADQSLGEGTEVRIYVPEARRVHIY